MKIPSLYCTIDKSMFNSPFRAQEDPSMRNHRSSPILLAGLLLFALSTGLLGQSGFVYAADRTVVGELWSSDG